MGLLGFSSGIPLPITSSTLQAYLTVHGIDLRIIGAFTSLSFPYTLKFLWASLFDRLRLPFLGRRRGFILIFQVIVFILIVSLPVFDPKEKLKLVALFSLLLSLFSATQDIVIDAYRTDNLSPEERAKGASTFIMGYRVGMLSSSAIALIIADRYGWNVSFLFMGCLMLLSVSGTLMAKEEQAEIKKGESLLELTKSSIMDLLSKEKSLLILLFISTYKIGDAYLGAMTVPFLISALNFSPLDIGVVNKALGFGFTLLGAALAGLIMDRLDLWKSLFYFGILQLLSNLCFILLALSGKSYPLLCICVAFENLSGGMGTTAFITLIMSLCNKAYSGTQFALLSSLSAFGRVLISPTSGFVAHSLGWIPFLFLSSLLALPGLLILAGLKGRI